MNFGERIRERTSSGKFVDLTSTPIGDFDALGSKYEKALQDCFLNMFRRTSLSLDRMECRADPPVLAGRSAEKEKEIRLALVSSAIRGPRAAKNGVTPDQVAAYNEQTQDVKLDRVAGGRRILRYMDRVQDNLARRTEWRVDRVHELRRALSREPHIVCFPEFAVPMPLTKEDMHGYVNPSVYGKHFDKFEARCISTLQEAHPEESNVYPFVFMGSYHCPREHYNTGLIFPTGGFVDRRKVHLVRQEIGKPDLKEDLVSMDMPMLHRKFFPARRAGEKARVPDGMEFFTYRAHGRENSLSIGVLICSDVLDLNQFLNMARLGSLRDGRDPLDIILVPSYNASFKLATMCRELSLLASTCVAFVNANPVFDEFPSTEMFMCGYDVNELQSHLPDEQKVLIEAPDFERVKSDVDDCESEIMYVRIDRQNFRWLQKQFRDQAYEMFRLNRVHRRHSSDE